VSGYSKQRGDGLPMPHDDEKDGCDLSNACRATFDLLRLPPPEKGIARCGCRQSESATKPRPEMKQAGRQDRAIESCCPRIGARPHACFTATSTDRDRPNSIQPQLNFYSENDLHAGNASKGF